MHRRVKRDRTSMMKKNLGVILIVMSFVPWLAGFGVPFLPLSIGLKALLAPALIGVGELLFWGGIVLAGKQVADRYRQWFSPRHLWLLFKVLLRRIRS